MISSVVQSVIYRQDKSRAVAAKPRDVACFFPTPSDS